MKALGWDDDSRYLKTLREILRQDFGIDLVVEEDDLAFLRQADDRDKHWDFLIVDLLDERAKLRGRRLTGRELCFRYGSRYPMYLVTQEPRLFHTEELAGIPASVVMKSKGLEAGWMAYEIVDDLRRRGIYVDTKRIFLIYGHDSEAPGATEAVEKFLRDELRLEVVKLTPSRVRSELLCELIDSMREAAAFVAICTPDDHTADGVARTRQNVILEIGIAMGLIRGPERLVVLQRAGEELGRSFEMPRAVELPSDMGGYVSLRFADDIRESFPALRDRLTRLRVHGL